MQLFVVALMLLAGPGLGTSTSEQGAVVFRAGKANPVAKVVELLQELEAKIEADGKTEAGVYDKFACWCEETTAKKANAIEQAKADIADMEKKVLQLTAQKATLGVELGQLEKDIAEGKKSVEDTEALRKKEKEEYITSREEMEQCIQALHKAIEVLANPGGGEKEGASEAEESALQQAAVLSAAAGVKEALHAGGSLFAADTRLKSADAEAVREFVENPTLFYARNSEKTEIGFAQLSAGSTATYNPASGQIQGILKQMYDDFHAKLEKSNAEEATKAKNYEKLMGAKEAELASQEATLGGKTSMKSEGGMTLAETKQLLDDTKAQLEYDEKFFAETQANCKQTAKDWSERSRLRTEELAGIKKGIEILNSPEAQKKFTDATSNKKAEKEGGGEEPPAEEESFLQLGMKKEEPWMHAKEIISKMATKTGSLRLAYLAAKLRTATGGHFDVVIRAIDKMLKELREEAKTDIEKMDWCDKRLDEFKIQMEDLKIELENHEELIERMETKGKELEAAMENTMKNIQEQTEALEEAKNDRDEERADFLKANQDDRDAVELLTQAIAALTQFYADNNIPMFLQNDKKPKEEKQMSAGFGSGYQGAKGESQGIVSILKMIKEDLEREIKEGERMEQANIMEYDKARTTSQEILKEYEDKKWNQISEKSRLDDDTAHAKGDRDLTIKDIENVQKELDSVEPECDWLKENFDSRTEKRKTEIDALVAAKAVLAGQEMDEEAASEMLMESQAPRVVRAPPPVEKKAALAAKKANFLHQKK